MPTRNDPGPTCLILDEHPVVRQGVRALLEGTWPQAEIHEAPHIDAVEPGPVDVVVADPSRSAAGVGSLVARLDKELSAPIVIFTADGGARMLSEALEAGVKAYVRKDSPPADLIRGIEAARGGSFYVDPQISSALLVEEGDRTLSQRQRQILQMLADGMQTDEVASDLGLSTETVRTHTKRILAKLGASTRTQAVAVGIRHGLIE